MTLTISIGAFIVISMISYFIAQFYTILNNIEIRTYSLLTTFQIVFIITKLLYYIIPSESLWIIGTIVLVIFKICLYFFIPIINLLYFLLILLLTPFLWIMPFLFHLTIAFGLRIWIYSFFVLFIIWALSPDLNWLSYKSLFDKKWVRWVFIGLWITIVLVAIYNDIFIIYHLIQWYYNIFLSHITPSFIYISGFTHCLGIIIKPILIEIINCDSPMNEFVQYVPHNHYTRGYAQCLEIFNSLDSNSNLYKYLSEHCQHLMHEPNDLNTRVPKSLTDVHILIKSDYVKLGNNYTANYTNQYKGYAGVYAFFTKDEIVQVGSNLDFHGRLSSHFWNCRYEKIKFYITGNKTHGGLSAYNWIPIYLTTNHIINYHSLFQDTLSIAHGKILDSFTQQDIRTVEYAYSQAAKPRYYNTTKIITLSHLNWNSDLDVSKHGHIVQWTTEDGIVHETFSIRKTSQILGVPGKTITDTCNCHSNPYWVNSPNYGPVTFVVDTLPEKNIVEINTYGEKNHQVDTSTLTPGLYYLYDKDIKQLPYGPYTILPDVNQALGYSRDFTSRPYLNRTRILHAITLGFGVYIVCNIKKAYGHNVIVRNIESGVSTLFESVSAAIISLGINQKHSIVTQFTRKYILRGELYNGHSISYQDSNFQKIKYDEIVKSLEQKALRLRQKAISNKSNNK